MMQVQSISIPKLPNTYQDAIKLFPADLQSGFYAMYTVMSSVLPEKSALTSMHSYYLTHWLKENYIIKEKGSEVINDQAVMAGYTQQRATLIANLDNFLPTVAFFGNPGDTNWDVWVQLLMEWM